jgi:DNA-binding winged helix-turn-helix (wHTH) protein
VPASLLRFGGFDLDPANFQLRRAGRPLRLERIPMEVLLLLVERRGQLVLCQEIVESVWGRDVVLDIDNALNTAIRKVRHSLGDDPDHARYVETVPAKGYRFIGAVTSASRPLETLHPTNLPVQPSRLVGREQELADAGSLIGSHRLLTLTGPGGSGKTRVALQLATQAGEQFPDGVFWVPLQAIRDPALVEQAIGASVGADGDLIAYVASKRLLVVLDNFEQVVKAAPVVSALLAGTPNAKVLITSRCTSTLSGDTRLSLCPSTTPRCSSSSGRARSPRGSARRRRWARSADGSTACHSQSSSRRPGWRCSSRTSCWRGSDGGCPCSPSRSRNAPARQRTPRATIEWSYELLEPNEQQLFRRAAVFTGSFSLAAAEAVCDTDFDTLESLVEKNLLRRWGGGRLGMLDTIREYALGRGRGGEAGSLDRPD